MDGLRDLRLPLPEHGVQGQRRPSVRGQPLSPARSPDGGGRHPCGAGAHRAGLARAGRRAPHGRAGPLLLRLVLPARRGDRRGGCDGVPERPTEGRGARLLEKVQVPRPLLSRRLLPVHAAMGIPLRPDQHPHPDVHRLRLPRAEPCAPPDLRRSLPGARADPPDLGTGLRIPQVPLPRLRAAGLPYLRGHGAPLPRHPRHGAVPAPVLVPEPVSSRGAAGAPGAVRALPAADHGGGVHPLRTLRIELPDGGDRGRTSR